MNTPQSQAEPTKTFNPNPFTLAFSAMSRAFKLNQTNAIVIIVVTFVAGVLNQITNAISNVAQTGIENSSSDGLSAIGSLLFLFFTLVVFIVSIVFGALWQGYLARVGLSNAKNETISFGDASKFALRKFWSVLGYQILLGLFVMLFILPAILVLFIGSILLGANADVVGGVIVGLAIIGLLVSLFFALRFTVARNLSLYAMFDESLGVMDSMKRSTELTKKRLVEAYGMAFVSVVPFVGTLLQSVGLGDHYLQLKSAREQNAVLPKIHYLTWLPTLILILLSGLFVFLLILLLAVSSS